MGKQTAQAQEVYSKYFLLSLAVVVSTTACILFTPLIYGPSARHCGHKGITRVCSLHYYVASSMSRQDDQNWAL